MKNQESKTQIKYTETGKSKGVFLIVRYSPLFAAGKRTIKGWRGRLLPSSQAEEGPSAEKGRQRVGASAQTTTVKGGWAERASEGEKPWKSFFHSEEILIYVFGFWCLISGFSFSQEIPITPKTEEVKGFTITIVDKGGREKASISGSRANILPEGLIEILEVVARIYPQRQGGSDTLVHTSKGVYDKMKNIVTTDQFVRINSGDMVITGIGLVWIPDRQKIEIKENVRVEYSYERGEDNVGGKRTTVIISRGGGTMDYQRDIAIFKRNVVVEDPDAILRAHRMKIFFNDNTQAITMVEAYGNVRIKQPKRESMSRKAVYYVGEDKIVLTGNPRIAQGLDFYTADKVTIYNKGERVVFEPKAQLVIYASTEHEAVQ